MASPKIHPTSVLSADVEIGQDVEIGPYCLIQGKVKIGSGTFIEGHATVGYRTGSIILGDNNHITDVMNSVKMYYDYIVLYD